MRMVIIGAGGIAEKAYFPLLNSWPYLEIAGVYSRSERTIEEAGKKWGFQFTTTNIEDLLELKPDAAFVISSTESHYQFCKLFLENGVDVYSEKSLTESSKESYELARIAEQYKRILAIGFNRRYALLCEKAKEIISNRQIQFALFQKHRPEPSHEELFQYYLDDVIHQIDLVRFFCGEVNARTTICDRVDEKVSSALSIMDIPGGGRVVVAVSRAAGAWQETVDIHGSGISLHIDMFRHLVVRYKDHEVVYGTDRAGNWTNDLKERGFQGEIAHFLECIHTRRNPLTNAVEAAKTLELLEALIEKEE